MLKLFGSKLTDEVPRLRSGSLDSEEKGFTTSEVASSGRVEWWAKRRVSKLKVLTVFKLIAVTVLALAAVLVFGSSKQQVAAHDVSSAQESEVYTYVAQPGDSYTKMARKAVQTFGITEKIDVSQAGIVFAETNLTKAAGSPSVDVGEQVEIKVTDVDDWVDKATELTDSQEAAWNYYVQFVDFNTDSVGQAS